MTRRTGGIGRFAERLRAQLDPAHFDDVLGHVASFVSGEVCLELGMSGTGWDS